MVMVIRRKTYPGKDHDSPALGIVRSNIHSRRQRGHQHHQHHDTNPTTMRKSRSYVERPTITMHHSSTSASDNLTTTIQHLLTED